MEGAKMAPVHVAGSCYLAGTVYSGGILPLPAKRRTRKQRDHLQRPAQIAEIMHFPPRPDLSEWSRAGRSWRVMHAVRRPPARRLRIVVPRPAPIRSGWCMVLACRQAPGATLESAAATAVENSGSGSVVRVLVCGCVLLLCTASGGANSQQPEATMDIGDSVQLFVDDLLVADSNNLTRVMHSPAVVQIAVAADAPWEQDFTIGIIGTSVVMDGGKIRLWYQLRNKTLGCGHGDQPSCAERLPPQPNYEPSGGLILTAYAESTDGGRTFVKPLLHRYSLNGSTANNIIGFVFFEPGSKHKGNLTHLNSIFVDPTQPSDSPRRFRGVSGAVPYFSHDGMNFTLGDPWNIPADPLFDGDWGTSGTDTQGEAFWDPPCANGRGCFSFYTRFKNEMPRPPPHFRMVRRARSFKLDGANWTNQTIVMRADALDNSTHQILPDASIPPVDYYGATPWYVDLGAGHGLYFMAAVRMWHWGPGPTKEDYPGHYDLALAVSRDGSIFDFIERTPWIRPGLCGTVGSRRMWLANTGPVLVGNEELYFVTRANTAEGPKASIDPLSKNGWEGEIGVGRLRRHGLVSLNAPYSRWQDAAVLRTKPFIFKGTRMLVNVEASGGGSLTVRLYHAGSANDDNPLLTSAPVVLNGVDLVVDWGATQSRVGNATAVAMYSGVPVRLVLTMQDCNLFSFQFTCSPALVKPMKSDDDNVDGDSLTSSLELRGESVVSDGSSADSPTIPPGDDTRVALEVLGAVTLVAMCASCVYCQCEWLERRRKRRASIQALQEQIVDGTERLLSAAANGHGSRLV